MSDRSNASPDDPVRKTVKGSRTFDALDVAGADPRGSPAALAAVPILVRVLAMMHRAAP
jgi:hypothetical protein